MMNLAVRAGCAGLALGLATLVLAAGPAEAQRRAAGERPPPAITVINKRAAALTELEISMPGADGKVVGTLTVALPAGKTTTVKLTGATGCVFSIKGSYDDESSTESDNVNLCKDKTVRLTD